MGKERLPQSRVMGVGGLSEEAAFQQRIEVKREPRGYLKEEVLGCGDQLVPKSWGSTVPGLMEERQGGPCGWNRVSKEERGRT